MYAKTSSLVSPLFPIYSSPINSPKKKQDEIHLLKYLSAWVKQVDQLETFHKINEKRIIIIREKNEKNIARLHNLFLSTPQWKKKLIPIQQTDALPRKQFASTCKKLLEDYERDHQTIVKYLQNKMVEISEKITKLPPIPFSFSEEAIEAIFSIESVLCKMLYKKNFAQENQISYLEKIGCYRDCEWIYQALIKPLCSQAKEFLSNRSIHASYKAAASKGKAATQAYTALLYISHYSRVLQPVKNDKSVYVLPALDIICKRYFCRQRKEEESNANTLLEIFAPGTSVPTYTFHNTKLRRLGVSMQQEERLQGYSLHKISSQLLNKIRSKMSENDEKLLNYYSKKVNKHSDIQNAIKIAKWYITHRTNMLERAVEFDKLQDMYRKNQFLPNDLVKSSLYNERTFGWHIAQRTDFFLVLTDKYTIDEVYLVPNFSPAEAAAYRYCEQFRWAYQDGLGEKRVVTFKELHKARVLHGKSLPGLEAYDHHNQKIPQSDIVAGEILLTSNWKLLTPEIFTETLCTAHGKPSIEKIENGITVKPYYDLILIKELEKQPIRKENILKRLTPEAQLKAVFTAMLQFMDWHDNNCGVSLVPNSDYTKFESATFRVNKNKKKIRLDALHSMYLNEKIDEKTIITFWLKGKKTTAELRFIPSLLTALESKWTIILFDTDVSLGESNTLNYQWVNKDIEYLVPLRSCLLETKWSHTPLTSECITLLAKSLEKCNEAFDWIKKQDAPIYKKLDSDTAKMAFDFIHPFLKRYTFKKYKEMHPFITLKQMEKEFVNQLINPENKEFEIFWKKMEGNIFYIWENSLGKKIRVKLADFPRQERIKKKMIIAKQFFPRLTILQQQALFERLKFLKDYLGQRKPEELPSYFDLCCIMYPTFLPDAAALSRALYFNPGKHIGEFRLSLGTIAGYGARSAAPYVRTLAEKILKKIEAYKKEAAFFGDWGDIETFSPSIIDRSFDEKESKNSPRRQKAFSS